jgi:hypothetical protein
MLPLEVRAALIIAHSNPHLTLEKLFFSPVGYHPQAIAFGNSS